MEIDSYALPTDILGQRQHNVVKLLDRTIPELAGDRDHVVVPVDEVEAFALRRSTASFETNPADVHWATDAVLAGLDMLAREWPNVAFLATTNFPAAVDQAVVSRGDRVALFDLPDAAVAGAVLRGALGELGAE